MEGKDAYADELELKKKQKRKFA